MCCFFPGIIADYVLQKGWESGLEFDVFVGLVADFAEDSLETPS